MGESFRFCKLRKFVGKRRERRYVYWTMLVYIIALIGMSFVLSLSVLVVDPGDTIIQKVMASIEYGVYLFSGFCAALISTFLIRILIHRHVTGSSVKAALIRVLPGYLVGLCAVIFWGVGLWLLGSATVFGLIQRLIGREPEMSGFLMTSVLQTIWVISFVGASAITILRIRWFPKVIRNAARKSHSKLDLAAVKIEETREKLDGGNFEAASKALNTARDKVNTVREAGTAVPGVIERVGDIKEQVQASAAQLVEEAVSAAETYADGGQYVNADSTLTLAEEMADHFDVEDDRIGSLREEINSELGDIVDREQETMTDCLEQAEQAREGGDFDRAWDHLEVAEGSYDVIQTIIEEDDPSGLGKRLETVRQNIESDEEAAEIQEYKESVARLLDLDVPQVGIRDVDESAKAYERLYSVVRKITDPPYSSLPWDEFRAGLIDEMPDVADNRIAEYQQIVSDVETILSYLETANEAHPSVHADEWRTAVHTAVEEQYRDVLNPVIAQIERLEGGLWDREDLHRVSWEEFEQLIGLLYEDRGYTVNVTQGTADMGVDVWTERGGERVAIQVKQYTDGNTVGRETLQRLTSTIAKGDADKAVVVTSGEFARTAEQYAKDFGPNLEIINGEELIQSLSESKVPPPV